MTTLLPTDLMQALGNHSILVLAGAPFSAVC